MRVFGDAERSRDLGTRLPFAQGNLVFAQFDQNLFAGVTTTLYLAILSARLSHTG